MPFDQMYVGGLDFGVFVQAETKDVRAECADQVVDDQAGGGVSKIGNFESTFQTQFGLKLNLVDKRRTQMDSERRSFKTKFSSKLNLEINLDPR